MVNLGSIDKIPIGQGRCFVVNDKEIAVFRPRSGGLYAIDNRCPHRQGSLAEGVCDQNLVICPYHGHKFNLHTGVGSEGNEKIKVYQVQEEKEEILVEV